jgi:hypothetical protein
MLSRRLARAKHFVPFSGSVSRRYAPPPSWTYYSGAFSGCFRVAGVARYELYIGDGARPDLTAEPDDTSADGIFSFSLTPPESGEKTYYYLVRYRNAYGIVSGNEYSRTVTIDDAGALVLPALTEPDSLSVSEHQGRYVLISAAYAAANDGDYRATSWKIYATDTGVDPDPDADTPATVAISVIGGRAMLNYLAGPYAAGADVRALVRVYRTDDASNDGNTTVESITMSSAVSAPLDGAIFGGNAYET